LWEHPISYTDKPQQYFLMYYLVDTNRNNGCLRLIPGSHLKRHDLHDLDRRAHDGDEVGRAKNMNHPAFQKAEGEVDVPVRAGDVVIGDARLLHSAHANQSDQWRTVLTIWYWANYAGLPEAAQALVASHVTERSEWAAWSEQSDPAVQAMIPRYSGDVEPITWGRGPKKGLF
jgi:ectoine hydroxylase-related dioxygenase (phytanoyl-CoA dioxygenase family)